MSWSALVGDFCRLYCVGCCRPETAQFRYQRVRHLIDLIVILVAVGLPVFIQRPGQIRLIRRITRPEPESQQILKLVWVFVVSGDPIALDYEDTRAALATFSHPVQKVVTLALTPIGGKITGRKHDKHAGAV